jgi:hypothetical protein
MKTKRLVNSILVLPEKFHILGNVSFYSLLRETGYFEAYNQINEGAILDELDKQPEYVKHWLKWSSDKRSSSGWYFKQNENGKYIVGYFPKNEDLNEIEYSDSKEACAAFIKKEIEEIRRIDE